MHVALVDAAATRELRRSVLRPTWPVGSRMGSDVDDAVHIAALDGTEVVGACVLLRRPYPLRPDTAPAWQLRGMVTVPGRQRQGIGGLVLAGALDELIARQARLVWCEARTSARGFYEKHGFVAEGEDMVQAETGLLHFRMRRELSGPPTSSLEARRTTGA